MSEPSAAGVCLAYSYRPSLLGAQWQFKLTDDYLEWSTGRRSGRTPYRDVRRVRMSFRPVSMQSQRYQTEVWAEGAPKLAIVSSSWKSMFEQERLDKPYSTFVTEFHRRLVRAAAPVRYEQGTQPLKYWPALVVFVGVALGLCALIVRGLQTDVGGGVAFIAGFLILVLWQGGSFLYRNRPGLYLPDAMPTALLPKG